MSLLILYIAVAIGVSFVCSVMEAVLLSVTPAYIGALEKHNPKLGGQLRTLKHDVDRPLAAILGLNTVAHTVGAAGAGAQAAHVFGSDVLGLFSAILTLGILVLSEIVPKTLGANYWRGLAGVVARALPPLMILVYPLVILSTWIAKLLRKEEQERDISREELSAMADIGVREGVLDPQERALLKNILRFNGLTARDVMTPRTVIVAFAEDKTVQEVVDADTPFSRLLVYSKGLDSITGFILKDEVLEEVAEDRHGTLLSALRRDVLTVHTTTPLPRIFELMIERREHIALVLDEYGGTDGVVTMEDVVETLLGLEIVDEHDRIDDMRKLARERWRRRVKKVGHYIGDDS